MSTLKRKVEVDYDSDILQFGLKRQKIDNNLSIKESEIINSHEKGSDKIIENNKNNMLTLKRKAGDDSDNYISQSSLKKQKVDNNFSITDSKIINNSQEIISDSKIINNSQEIISDSEIINNSQEIISASEIINNSQERISESIFGNSQEIISETIIENSQEKDQKTNTNKQKVKSQIYVIEDSDVKDGYYPVKIGLLFNNRYKVLKQLGYGGSSTVWQCWDKVNNCHVAMKIVRSEEFYIKSAKYEFKMLKYITKPRNGQTGSNEFVKLLDSFCVNGPNGIHACLIFENMNHDLRHLVNQSDGKGIPLIGVKAILRQVLESLDYLHSECEVIHTDIKPENVLMNVNKEENVLSVKISDFGSACRIKCPHSKGGQTFVYRSHEFLLKAPYGPPADIWSTACMAFELATGDRLFEPKAGDDYSRADDHLALTIAMLGEIPKHVALAGKRSVDYFTDEGKPRCTRNFKSMGLFEILTEKYKWDIDEAREFADFLIPMLAFDPELRPNAEKCREHSFLARKI